MLHFMVGRASSGSGSHALCKSGRWSSKTKPTALWLSSPKTRSNCWQHRQRRQPKQIAFETLLRGSYRVRRRISRMFSSCFLGVTLVGDDRRIVKGIEVKMLMRRCIVVHKFRKLICVNDAVGLQNGRPAAPPYSLSRVYSRPTGLECPCNCTLRRRNRNWFHNPYMVCEYQT